MRRWSPDDDAAVRDGWSRGLTTAAIAREIGVSKNAIIGRAHRLGLSRPSPIKLAPATPRIARAGRVTPPPLPSLAGDAA